jgi:hypothetical protein
MSRLDDPVDHPPDEADPLLKRYHEANALDGARPAPDLKAAVLAQARAAAAGSPAAGVAARPPAANDANWTLRALGSLAVLGLVGLLALQFERVRPDEREAAFGHPSPSAPAAIKGAPAKPDSGSPVLAPPAPTSAPSEASTAPMGEGAPKSGAAPLTPAPRLATAKPPSTAAQPVLPEVPAAPRTADPSVAAPDPVPATSAAPTEQAAKAQPQLGAGLDARSSARTPAVDGRQRAEASADSGAIALPAPAPAAPALRRSAPAGSPSMATESNSALGQARPSLTDRATPVPANAALLAAAVQGQVEAARAALAQGASVDAADRDGHTALMLAARRGDATLVRLLLDAGADPALTDSEGATAAMLAQRAGHEALLPLLQPR